MFRHFTISCFKHALNIWFPVFVKFVIPKLNTMLMMMMMIIVLNGNGNNYNYKNYKNKDCDIFVLQSEQFKNTVYHL